MRLNPVPASTGWLWIRQGVRTFFRQPLALGGLFFMFMGLVTLLSAIPLLGPLLAVALFPAGSAGLMAASREADAGRFPMPIVLATAFRQGPQRSRSMLVLGAIYAGTLTVVMLLAALLGFGGATPPAGGEMTPETMRAVLADGSLWWVLLLYLPVMAGFWHAPALLHWHGVSPVKALFFSLMACWANKGALLVFMVGWMGVMMAVSLVLSLLAALVGNATVLQVVLYPLVLLLAAMFNTSLYFSFHDSFESEAPSNAEPGETS